ncbi:MAG: ERCC4 domain-containing protein [Zestosphaera sp.]
MYVDERERSSDVPVHLSGMGVTVVFKVLEVGDYAIDEEIIIERKRVNDLVKSVYEGRFFNQLKRLKSVEGCKPLLVIEGNILDIGRYVENPKSVEAALIAAILSFNVPILYTKDSHHTAELIKYVAERTQKSKAKASGGKVVTLLPTYRKVRKPKTEDIKSWQIYILSSFPKIGPTLAERLLRKFGSLKAVINAQAVELLRVEGMTEERVKLLKKIVEESSSDSTSPSLEKFLDKSRQGQ